MASRRFRGAEDQEIVRFSKGAPLPRLSALEGARVRIDTDAFRLDIGDPFFRADRLDDAAKFYGADGRAGKERRKDEMVPGADDRDVVPRDIDRLKKAEDGEPAPEEDEPGHSRSKW